ncbi:MAG: isoaspartyl peptidase/L-asparaginase, partial [Gemmatimonadaceae bacterium]|nr:isoaspartyl peptidase/L-asparaginase [Gemmatimonadaceae bacterium]
MAISRREFLGAGAAAAATAAVSGSAAAHVVDVVDRTFAARSTGATRPVVVASGNGIRGVARAYDMITRDGADTLDAAIAGVNIQELDPADQSVGLGGLPNSEGVVQLDASCMHG